MAGRETRHIIEQFGRLVTTSLRKSVTHGDARRAKHMITVTNKYT